MRDSTFRLAPSNLFALHRNTTSDLERLGSYVSTETFCGRFLQMQSYQSYHSFAFVRRSGATACWMPKPKNVQQRTDFFEQNEMFNSRLDSISILLLKALGLRELESVWNR